MKLLSEFMITELNCLNFSLKHFEYAFSSSFPTVFTYVKQDLANYILTPEFNLWSSVDAAVFNCFMAIFLQDIRTHDSFSLLSVNSNASFEKIVG